MSRDKGETKVKRFLVQGTPELFRRLRVVAAHFDSGTEKFGAVLLDRAIAQVEAEIAAHKPSGERGGDPRLGQRGKR